MRTSLPNWRALQAGLHFDRLPLPALAAELIEECVSCQVDGECAPAFSAVELGKRQYDCIVHATRGRIIAEFESRAEAADAVALFAVKAHSSIERVRRQKNVDALLETAVRQVREFTGFDRVMAYRFREDDSGDVVAEARREDLVPYVGQRYPAGDIPAQARRMYVLTTLRMIADVGYQPVPMLGAPGRGAARHELQRAAQRLADPRRIPAEHGRVRLDERLDRDQRAPLGPAGLPSHGAETGALHDPHVGRRAGPGHGLDHPEHRGPARRRPGRAGRARAHQPGRVAADRRGTARRPGAPRRGLAGGHRLACDGQRPQRQDPERRHHRTRRWPNRSCAPLPRDASDLLVRDKLGDWPQDAAAAAGQMGRHAGPALRSSRRRLVPAAAHRTDRAGGLGRAPRQDRHPWPARRAPDPARLLRRLARNRARTRPAVGSRRCSRTRA